jgi:mannan endo-1,6-alpha-mannosidase
MTTSFGGLWVLLSEPGVITATEMYGAKAIMPNGHSYLQLAQNSINDVWQQHDMACGGGIFWSRNRQSKNLKQVNYKSAITYLNL